METPKNKADRILNAWLASVVSSIDFKPDRPAIRAELAGHMHDKFEEYTERYPALAPETAAEKVVHDMGDPFETAELLNRVHSRRVGRLWLLSRAVCIILAVAFFANVVLSGNIIDWNTARHPVYTDAPIGEWSCGEHSECLGYVFTPRFAELRKEESGTVLTMEVRIRKPAPWYTAPTSLEHMYARDSCGKEYPVHIREVRRGFFTSDIALVAEGMDGDTSRVTFVYDRFGAYFTLVANEVSG